MAEKSKTIAPEAKTSPSVEEFINVLQNQLAQERRKESGKDESGKEAVFRPDESEAGESMARFYEKVRNLIEYKDDHLIKRTAIERIIKRNLLIELRQQDFTDQFLEELTMTGYIDREEIGEGMKKKIKSVLAKYQWVIRNTGGYDLKKWLVAVSSCEIEEVVFPNKLRYVLVKTMYETICERIEIQEGEIKESEKEVQIFLAVLKALAKSDMAWLYFSLLKIYMPEWF